MSFTKRFYLPSTGAAAVSPAVSGYWSVTTGFDRLAMSTTPANTANGNKSLNETVAGNVHGLLRQYVGPNDLAAGDYSGTFQTVVCAEESISSAEMFLDLVIKIVDSTGTTVRGVLYAGQGTYTASASTSSPQYEFDQTPTRRSRILGTTLTPVTGVQAGDRIVVEYGYSDNNANTTGRTGTLWFGDETLDTDLAYVVDAGSTSTNRPWIEFVFNDLTSPPNVPTSLSATSSSDGTELDFDWAAPASGDAPTGYDVRIDGGSPTDVGLVLTHTFTGLTPDTAYTLEVRAYNTAGDSSWASLGATTDGPPDTPTGLVETVLTPTSVELDWTASTGSPTGYEVRVDGGTPTDVGNVVTHTFTGLYPGSTPVLEVRAYNDAGFSAWASVEAETPAPTESEFTATIVLGEHSWTIESGACDLDDPVQVLDSLRIGWEVSESDPWPAQPGAVSCQLGLWTADVAEVADVSIGTPLSVVLTDVAANVFGTFHGRVARQSSRIRKDGPGALSMLYSLTGVDYTVDLAETPISVSGTWPAEDAEARMARLFEALADAGVTMGTDPGDYGDAAFAAYAPGTTTAAALLELHLAQIAIDNGDGLQRYIVVPVVTGGVLERFDVVLLARTVDASLLPGRVTVDGGELVLEFPDLDADGLVDGCNIDQDVTWNRLKYRAVNVVTVTGAGVTATASSPGPPVRLTLGSDLTVEAAAQRMAELYLPNVDEGNGWVADLFRFYAHRTPAALTPAWFPDHREDPASTTVYVMPIAVVGIPANINLSGETAYAGQLVTVELLLEKKRAVVEFALRRQLPLSEGAEAVTWDWISSEHPTLTWDDVDPTLSWYDIRLGRIP